MDGKDMIPEKGKFIHCKKCGKRLIKRLPNGIWEFVFGKKEEDSRRPPVCIEVFGSIRMKCLNAECDHETVLNFFHPQVSIEKTKEGISLQSEVSKQSAEPNPRK
jgi:hypothetical protein